MNNVRFEFRLDQPTAKELSTIAQKWQRSQADTLRLLIKAASKLAVPEPVNQSGEIPEAERGKGEA